MNRPQMEQVANNLNQPDEVEDARIVEFLGMPHVHLDFTNGNIGVISDKGEYSIIPVRTAKEGET